MTMFKHLSVIIFLYDIQLEDLDLKTKNRGFKIAMNSEVTVHVGPTCKEKKTKPKQTNAKSQSISFRLKQTTFNTRKR